MSHRWNLLWSWWVRWTTGWLPDVPSVMRWRGALYGLRMPHAGRDFQVASNVRIVGLESLYVGQNVYFAPGVVVLCAERVEIESEVMLAFHSVVTDGNHTAEGGSYRFGPRDNRPVKIGRGSWVGAHATVVAGVTVGAGVLVGANSVVVSDVPDHAKVAGVPARPLGSQASHDRPAEGVH